MNLNPLTDDTPRARINAQTLIVINLDVLFMLLPYCKDIEKGEGALSCQNDGRVVLVFVSASNG